MLPSMRGADDEGNGSVARARATAGLIILAALAAGVVALCFHLGRELEAEPSIAGRYTVDRGGACLGTAFDLRQSGEFVSLSRPDGRRIARLRVSDGALSGEVACVDDETRPIEAEAADGGLQGRLGLLDLAASRSVEFEPGERSRPAPASVDGSYALSPQSKCLGNRIELRGGSRPELRSDERLAGSLIYAQGELRGPITCADGDPGELRGVAAAGRLEFEFERDEPGHGEQSIEQAIGEEQQDLGELAASFFVALIVVLAGARLLGALAMTAHQPRVMGEIVAGILLGPTLFGAVSPGIQAEVFSGDVLLALGVIANLGLVIYMFIVGIELDPRQLRGRSTQVLTVALASILVPLALGVAAALPIYELTAPDVEFIPFSLFIGIAMSITAFPVLARILEERGMLARPLGTAALAAAAIDDLLAWFLIALATAIAVAASAQDVLATVLLAALFGAAMVWIVQPLLKWAAARYAHDGASAWIAAVFAGILLSAFASEEIGIALIIGALAFGLVMPKRARLTEDLRRGSEPFVTIVLLPLFFAYTGLRTDVTTLGESELWLIAAGLLAVALLGKFVPAMLAARWSGFDWRASAVMGTLMNTRGLTELIVLNLALEAGVISEALFTALVLMALITTFMAGPLLRLLDPSNRFGSTVASPAPAAER
jgi:Kef-type K+ transport system membrane component KefB